MMPTFTGRLGCSLPINKMTLVAKDADGEVTSLVGSVAVLEIGSGFGAAPRLTVRSDAVPAEPAVFDYVPGAESSTLKIKLSPEQADSIGAGQWSGVVKIEGPDAGDVPHDVPTMTFNIAILRWPVAVE